MGRIPFWKMHGSGNDFILIDHRRPVIAEAERRPFVRAVCARKVGVGADGLIFIEPSAKVDFRWRFFNADGSEPEMCGNGGRCAARFAHLNGIAEGKMAFETLAGIVHAEVTGRQVRLEMGAPQDLRQNLTIPLPGQAWTGHFINTGVPHVVLPVADLEAAPVVEVGRAIRYHAMFQPVGTNVNFLSLLGSQEIALRTYERGVEDETLACGTGAVAAALIAARLHGLSSPVSVRPRSGELLRVFFDNQNDGFSAIGLEGEALVVYQGELWTEELQ
ncbi:MAG: diaminopimelate epimerase [Deltaproteobacteria bacterium]|nr:diaminopimelate epimerase [Deltaproteobacteria bacterium]MBW1953546.1 diaminopimelate epimerase [Deltaproteobacteria bacterium]MBW1987724.1 diaminopimelate epimerase [Deltaproteobacteria bacterium]MBW2134461.1 diaminopimelate epimerase [Deltaproteobacteria bacterium]